MDLTKAHRLLHKIQAFLDNGNGQELSRLEKDLIRSYILQLYDTVTMDDGQVTQEHHKPADVFEPKKYREEPTPKAETHYTKPTEVPKQEVYKQEPPKVEPVKPVYSEYSPPVEKEKPVEVERSVPEVKWVPPQEETKSYQYQPTEPVKETVQSHKTTISTPTHDQQQALNKLFDVEKADDVSHRFGHVPIASIESAMGLNERIFTLNELFGGDKALFDSTCSRLNNLNSFAEAKSLLISGPAKDFRWGDPERLKMAEQFLRIVARRYPKSVS